MNTKPVEKTPEMLAMQIVSLLPALSKEELEDVIKYITEKIKTK